MIGYSLTRPFSYLTIKSTHKWKFDWGVPFFLTIISWALLFYFRRNGGIAVFTGDSLIGKILGFVQNLPGFYIAALAAIATFNRADIDRLMPSPSPKIGLRIKDAKVVIDLTRRRFLCSLFAFLTAESIFLVIISIFSQTIASPIKSALCEIYRPWLSNAILFVYLLLFWQMLTVSFLGLFYLGDRLHQPDEDARPPAQKNPG